MGPWGVPIVRLLLLLLSLLLPAFLRGSSRALHSRGKMGSEALSACHTSYLVSTRDKTIGRLFFTNHGGCEVDTILDAKALKSCALAWTGGGWWSQH